MEKVSVEVILQLFYDAWISYFSVGGLWSNLKWKFVFLCLLLGSVKQILYDKGHKLEQ